MPIAPETAKLVSKKVGEANLELAKNLPPGFGFVIVAFEEGTTGWTMYASTTKIQDPMALAARLQETADHMRETAAPKIHPEKGQIIDFPRPRG